MTIKEKIDWLMGVWYENEKIVHGDRRGRSVVHFPSAVKCPNKDCDERGIYTNCYLPKTMEDCPVYREGRGTFDF